MKILLTQQEFKEVLKEAFEAGQKATVPYQKHAELQAKLERDLVPMDFTTFWWRLFGQGEI